MLLDGVYLKNETTEYNMKTLSDTQVRLMEKRICELAELAEDAAIAARELYAAGCGIYEILGILSDGVSFEHYAPHSHAMRENVSRLHSYTSSVESKDRAILAELLVSRLSEHGITLTESDFLPEDSGDESFVYVKNRLADEAYDVFSQDFDDPHVRYEPTLRDAARAVSKGGVEYCLLPLEERGGARLPSVAALLFAEDLKICSVTPVFGFDGSADMKYALVSRHFTVPEVSPDDDRYLEIRISAASTDLAELFSVAEHLGTTVYRVNTVTFDTEDGEAQYYTAVLRKGGSDFCTLLAYLTLFCPSYTAVGIYNNLE